MTKKLFTVLLILLISVSVFATPVVNNQRVLSVQESQRLKYDMILDGKTLPSQSYPFTKSEYNLYSLLANKEVEDFKVANEYANLSFVVNPNLNFFVHANKNLLTTNFSFKEQLPLVGLGFDFYTSSFLYSQFIMEIRESNKATLPSKYSDFANAIFRSNTIFIPPSSFGQFSLDSLPKAYINFGGKSWNLFIGRDQVEFGNGFSGNLLLTNNMDFYDMIRVSAFGPNFKYTFLTTFFMDPINMTWNDGQNDPLLGLYFYMLHRLEFSVLDNKLNFALNEGILYVSDEGHFDLQVFNPINFYHGYYIRGNANSIISLEANYTPIKGLNFYFQWAIDEINIEGLKDSSRHPDAMAGILGVNAAKEINDGLFYFSAEGVYVSPMMYLRNRYAYPITHGGVTSNTRPRFDFTAIQRYFIVGSELVYDERYLGYTYGNDCAVFAAKGGYESNQNWTVEGNFEFIAHGTYDMYTNWYRYADSKRDWPLTNNHSLTTNEKPGAAARDAISYTINLRGTVKYDILDSLSVFSTLEWEGIVNHKNLKSNKFIQDIKFNIGLSYKGRWDNLV